MCTALVVREEYWDKQLEICAKIRGFDINRQQIEHMKVLIIDFARDIGTYLKTIVDAAVEAFSEMAIVIKEGVTKTMEELSRLFKECEIMGTDDFDLVCDKLENRMLYLNRQNCIRQEQYYKAQFKLAKVNYNIMNHDRRC